MYFLWDITLSLCFCLRSWSSSTCLRCISSILFSYRFTNLRLSSSLSGISVVDLINVSEVLLSSTLLGIVVIWVLSGINTESFEWMDPSSKWPESAREEGRSEGARFSGVSGLVIFRSALSSGKSLLGDSGEKGLFSRTVRASLLSVLSSGLFREALYNLSSTTSFVNRNISWSFSSISFRASFNKA